MTRNVLYADDEPERCAHGKVIPMPDWRKQIQKDVNKYYRLLWFIFGFCLMFYAFGFAYALHCIGWWR